MSMLHQHCIYNGIYNQNEWPKSFMKRIKIQTTKNVNTKRPQWYGAINMVQKTLENVTPHHCADKGHIENVDKWLHSSVKRKQTKTKKTPIKNSTVM